MTHVEELLKHGIKTLMVGGQVKPTTMATVGANALETLRRYCFDRAFIGMNGIDVKYGLTTPDEQEALIKETAMKLSNHKYVLVDQSKFNQIYFARVPILDGLSIITSQKAMQSKMTEAYMNEFFYRREIMIYTVTFNPSIDYIIFTDGFEISGLNRAKATYKFAGGKGINVSRVLKTLDVDSTALGFSGGFLEILLLKHLRTVISNQILFK